MIQHLAKNYKTYMCGVAAAADEVSTCTGTGAESKGAGVLADVPHVHSPRQEQWNACDLPGGCMTKCFVPRLEE